MRVLLAVLLVVCCVASTQALKGTPKTCTISGDPHIRTFDGLNLDYQGIGTYRVAKNDYLEVQSTFIRCTESMSCVRSSTVQVNNRESGEVATISFGLIDNVAAFAASGSFPASQAVAAAVDDVLITSSGALRGCSYQNGVNRCGVSALSDSVSVAGYTVSSQDQKLTISENRDNGVVVIVEKYTLTVSVPYEQETLRTNGLCGYMDGSPTLELVTSDNKLAPIQTNLDGQYSDDKVNTWALSFAVGAGITPLAAAFGEHHLASVGQALAPNAADQAALSKVQFSSFASLQAADQLCSKSSRAGTVYDNCMYDLAAAGSSNNGAAFANSNSLAAANVAAINSNFAASNASSSSSMSSAVVALIAVGCVAAIAVVAAVVMAVRLRKARQILTVVNNIATN